jgi:hypothetical protein
VTAISNHQGCSLGRKPTLSDERYLLCKVGALRILGEIFGTFVVSNLGPSIMAGIDSRSCRECEASRAGKLCTRKGPQPSRKCSHRERKEADVLMLF